MIDSAFTFANLPAGEQTVSLHLQNRGTVSCRLHGQGGSSFAVDSHSMATATCWLCDAEGKPAGRPDLQPGDQITLAPGGRATIDFQWAATGTSCQWADWTDFQFHWREEEYSDFRKDVSYLFVPAAWPFHLCSAVSSSGYRAETESAMGGSVLEGQLRVSVPPHPIYNDERVTLHVERLGRPNVLAVGCAELYIVRQGPEIGTRFDPLPTLSEHKAASYTALQLEEDRERAWPEWKRDRLRRCPIDAGAIAADAEIGAAELASVTRIEWRTATAPGKEPRFFSAAAHFTVLDPDTLAPNWGATVNGIRAGLSVDRTTFFVGDKLPLHLRYENVSAAKPLGVTECNAPEPVLELQDAQHKVLHTLPIDRFCSGHGWGPFAVEQGKRQRLFHEVTTDTVSEPYPGRTGAPDVPGPGVYYLVTVWSPVVLVVAPAVPGETATSSRAGHGGDRLGEIYGSARSLPVRIEVLPRGKP